MRSLAPARAQHVRRQLVIPAAAARTRGIRTVNTLQHNLRRSLAPARAQQICCQLIVPAAAACNEAYA
jgi:hypothetical protein